MPSEKRLLNTGWQAPTLPLLLKTYTVQESAKKDGGWGLINHLSDPNGLSINDFIDSHDYSLQYAIVDDSISICQTLGKGALMAMMDLKMPSGYA